MKRVVKRIRQRKGGKVYTQAWIGYNYRNKNGTPDFKREVSLRGLSDEEVDKIATALREGGTTSVDGVKFMGSQDIGAFWAAYRIAEELGIVREIRHFKEEHQYALLCMILDRVVQPLPHSKLGLFEYLQSSALERVLRPHACEIKLADVYNALDEANERQREIQKALYMERETVDRMYLYDITSSYFEGSACPLGAYGYNRDGKRGKLQIVIGLLTDSDGRPIAVEVFEGNTQDQTTVMKRIDEMRSDFGIDEMIFIGDRGMVTSARRKDLNTDEYEKVKYISALKRKEFFRFLEDQDHPLQLTLFDRNNLVEVENEGVRYVLSFNPEKEQEDRQTRLRLIERTEEKLEMIRRNVENGRLKSEQAIARKYHRWANNWNMERFFDCQYGEGEFSFTRDEEAIKEYEAIDGFYAIITDVCADELQTDEVRNRYKSLAKVEQAFRTMKTTDLFVRPIRHWKPERVRGHVFVCMLSYLVIWKARSLFQDFIKEGPVDGNEARPEDCHSLRAIWETLEKGVQIGRIKISGSITEQLNQIPAKAKQILRAAKATLTKKARLKLASSAITVPIDN